MRSWPQAAMCITPPVLTSFSAVFVATAMSIISGAVAERMKLWSFCYSRRHDGFHLPDSGKLELGRWFPV